MRYPHRFPRFAPLLAFLLLIFLVLGPIACARADKTLLGRGAPVLAHQGQTGSTAATGYTGQYTVRFEPAELVTRQQGEYVHVSLPGWHMTTEPGRPQLPAKAVTIYVPQGKRAVGVRMSYTAPRELFGDYLVWPAQPPVPISSGVIPDFVSPDPAVYLSARAYPGELAVFLGPGSLSGHGLADVMVFPVQYIPAKRKLVLYTEITLSLVFEDCEDSQIVRRTPRTEKLFADAARGIVVNPEDVAGSVARFGAAAPMNGDIVEYLIITGDEFAEGFAPLAEWKTLKGIPAHVITTSEIYSGYGGIDDAERIRNCIKDYWQNKGLAWVLLAGDVDVVPTRFAFAVEDDYGDQIPCDLYFSDLDGDWNYDGDTNWGEYPEDQVDMYCDVYVGRAPIDKASHVERFVNKVLQYEGQETSYGPPEFDYQDKALFVASLLDEVSDGADLKEAIDGESFVAEWDPITKLYESQGNLTTDAAVAELDAGYNLVNHDGHGNTAVIGLGGEHYLSYDEIGPLANAPRFTGVFVSTGCFTCEFPAADCIAEWFVLIQDGGGFYIGNSRYGWYYIGHPSEGLTARLDRSFFYHLFNNGRFRLGEAYGEAKNNSVPYAKSDPSGEEDIERYCLYEFTLLGDPELPLWTETPIALSAMHPETIGIGYSRFEVAVTADGAPQSGATVCLDKENDFYLVGETDYDGTTVFDVYSSSEGMFCVTATYENHIPYEGTAEVLPGECTVTLAPDPQPGCGGALFGRPENGYPGWGWFSIPLYPASCCESYDCSDPGVLLGFDTGGRIWLWHAYGKCPMVYRPPFAIFDLAVGVGYLAYLETDVPNPSYSGIEPSGAFEHRLGSIGWTWVGKPGDFALPAGAFGDQVLVRYPSSPDGEVRTAAEDAASASPWLSWVWEWHDTHAQAERTFAPFSGGAPSDSCHPWLGYRAYVRLGAATASADDDQVTIIWQIGD